MISAICTSLGHGRNGVLKIFDDEIYVPLVVQLDASTVTRLHHRVRAVSCEGAVGGEFVRGERGFDGGWRERRIKCIRLLPGF